MLTFFTGLAETFYHGEPYRLLAIVGPISTTMAIFIFCRTDSERSTAYFSLFVVYSALYLSVMQRTAFDIFTLHYTSYLILGGLILGIEGILLTFLLNACIGYYILTTMPEPEIPQKPQVVWLTFWGRIVSEASLIIISILKFNETFARFEEADKHKTEFLCRMSHELRTPLSGIIGAIDILKFAPLTDEYVKLINIAKSCSTNLLQVINDILDFSKIEAGKMKLARDAVRIRSVVDASSEVVSPLLNQKPAIKFVKIVTEQVPDMIIGDKTKIKQILVNLLSNAIKFTKSGSIRMKVDLDSKEGISRKISISNGMTKTWAIDKEFVRFSVKDTGIGVSGDDFGKIFSAFEQLSNKKGGEVVGGTGLGLNICMLLVKLMQGAISITSDGIDKGTKFTFWIPKKDDASLVEEKVAKRANSMLIKVLNERQTPAPMLKDLKSSGSDEDLKLKHQPLVVKPSIFLVEDNPVNQMIIKGQLVKLGCYVNIASNGQLALEHFKTTPTPKYDIILLDLEMPVLDGIATAMELREKGVKTPIIALTAHAVEEKRTMALKAGMDDFLMKPCSIDTLKQCLDDYRKKPSLERRNSYAY
jgi:signal transduction histidine kinase/ActR/RegA family two-component response regulator